MENVDEIAAVRATLELLTADNDDLIEHFKELNEKLEVIEKMPPGIKAVQFRQLEQSGAFKFNNADIRHFAKSTQHALTPPQFVERTNRRLHNTGSLIDAFLKVEEFEGGKELKSSIDKLTKNTVDTSDQQAVVTFKNLVQTLRDTSLFKNYLEIKSSFLKKNSDLKDEADFMATKEAVADGEMAAEVRGEELKDIQQGVESGEVSAADAQIKLDEIESETEPAAEPDS
ncbi:MAG: hypothetical protein O6934_02005 [SAR324 cluster bacterium]|nr:hypothetical protein [SAR324 cluster bacterium]MCZ6730842.1 hypothetical protein [SAR324 cluster bacterium]